MLTSGCSSMLDLGLSSSATAAGGRSLGTPAHWLRQTNVSNTHHQVTPSRSNISTAPWAAWVSLLAPWSRR